MAQIVSREQPRASVTVAELLRRCAPALELDHDDSEPVPVGALLRREGRGTDDLPRVPDLSQPKAADAAPVSASAKRGLLVRRSALAAGALLAAGSAFGLVTAMHATGEQPAATGSYPGEGALDGVSGDNPATPLDSGTAAPTSWMPVAFPTALGGSTVAKHALAAAPPARAATPAIAAGPAHASTTGTSTRQATSNTAPSTSQHSSVGGTVADTTRQLGGTVSTVGQDTPVAGVTNAVGTTVADAGTTLGRTTAPVVDGVVSATTPVVAGTTSTLSSVATSATGAVGKTLGGLLG